MISTKQEVGRSFSERAAEWAAGYADPEPRTLPARNLLARQQLALELVQTSVPRGSTVLDLGCGTGEMSLKLAQIGYEVWGLDLAERMIQHARNRSGSDRFWVGDMENIPFPDQSFHAVVCLGAIEYLAADERALREIVRVLRHGGTAVISTPSAISPLYHADRLCLVLTTMTRPLFHLVKYHLRGKRPPVEPPWRGVHHRRYFRGSWFRLLRSVGLEPDEWLCHGWGWYRSRLGGLVERLTAANGDSRPTRTFVGNRMLNWLAAEQLVRVRLNPVPPKPKTQNPNPKP